MFWAGIRGWSCGPQPFGGLAVTEGEGLRVVVLETETTKAGQNRNHVDLPTSSSAAMQSMLTRAFDLGARRIDIGQSPDEPHEMLADPEGNEFCVIAPGNRFLAGTGVVGAINCAGTRAAGHFWSKALDWRWCGTRTRRPRSNRRMAGSR